MNVAILTISSLSLVCSLGTLAIMAKTAYEMKKAKDTIELELEQVKVKVNHNARVVKTAISSLEV